MTIYGIPGLSEPETPLYHYLRNIKKKVLVLYLWPVLSLWRMLKKKQTSATLSGLGSSPYAAEYSLTVTISREPTLNFFRGLAFRSSVSDKNAHRTPNWQMKIEIFENDEVTASDLTRDKNVS